MGCMTYAKLKTLPPEAFRRYSGVKPETFRVIPALQGTLLEVLELIRIKRLFKYLI